MIESRFSLLIADNKDRERRINLCCKTDEKDGMPMITAYVG